MYLLAIQHVSTIISVGASSSSVYCRFLKLELTQSLSSFGGFCYRRSAQGALTRRSSSFDALPELHSLQDLSIAWGFVPDNQEDLKLSRPKLQHSSLDLGLV
jgi:hypothetical protein